MASLNTKAQDAYQKIKDGLRSGAFQPGDRLSEARVCQSLGLRRGPVREALLVLHGEGFTRKPGPYQSHLVDYIEDVPPDLLLLRCELREQISAGACRSAAKCMNGWQIDALQSLAQRVCDSMSAAHREARYEANYALHAFLMENCGNPLMREIWQAHHLMPPRPRSPYLEDEILAQVEDINRPSLTDIVAAIAAHDPDEAEAQMAARVRKITKAIRCTVHPHQARFTGRQLQADNEVRCTA